MPQQGKTTLKIADIAHSLNIKIDTALADCEVKGINTLTNASNQELSFLANAKYSDQLKSTQACAIFVNADMADKCPGRAIVVKDPYLAFAKTLSLFYPPAIPRSGIHPSAVIDASAQIDSSVSIGPHVVIEQNVRIGKNCAIDAGVFVGKNTEIQEGAHVFPNATIYEGCKVGKRVIIHSGAVIGADGFGFANEHGKWIKIPQIGAVSIGDDVEIGANAMIDRGALQDTIIGQGVKIDNAVQIAHNVSIGEHTVMAALTAVAGSTKIGKYCMIGGCSAIAGHVSICDQVMIAGASAVGQSIKKPGEYGSAISVQEKRVWQRNMMRFIHLDDFVKRFKALEKIAEPYLARSKGEKKSWIKWIFNKF